MRKSFPVISQNGKPAAGPDVGFTSVAFRPAFICWLLTVVTFAVFGAVIGYDFVDLDDYGYILENPHVQAGLNGNDVLWAFRTGLGGNWHPLTWLSWMLDVQLFGMSPGGFHLTNLALHAANAVLLFLVLRLLTGAHWRSAAVAALFAWHPLHVESVAWIAERKDVLSTLFWMLTLWAYARYAHKGRAGSPLPAAVADTSGAHGVTRPAIEIEARAPGYYWLSLLFFACGLMSKPMLVTLPFVLLLLDYWPLQRFQLPVPPWRRSTFNFQLPTFRRLLFEKLPFFALSAIVSLVTFLVQKGAGAVAPIGGLPFTARIGNALVSYARYLGKTFWPVELATPYPHPTYWPAAEVILAAMLVTGLTVVVLWLSRRWPFLVTGWFWFFGMLIPVIGLVQVGGQSMADRYTYVPLIGLFIVLVWGANVTLAAWLQPRARAITSGAVAAGLLVACAARSADQLSFWRDGGSLFLHALAVTKNNDIAHDKLAHYLLGVGRLGDAETHYRASLRLKPGVADSYGNLGVTLARQGRLAEAIVQFQLALQHEPKSAEAHANLGRACAAQGQIEAAIQHHREALRLRPDWPEALNNLAWILATHPEAQHRNGAEATRLAARAVELTNQQDAGKLDTLAAAYAEAGRFAEAVETARRAMAAAMSAGQKELAGQIAPRLKLYQDQRTYRQPPVVLAPNAAGEVSLGVTNGNNFK
jgi:Tfp pilus assembly protein PilF